MPYRLKRGDASVENGLRRIAIEQIDRALAELDDPELPADETVHQVRKRLKKLRGLARLVRPAFSAYAEENARFRDAARSLSGIRDVQALIGTYDDLVEHFSDQIERPAFASIRRRLTLRDREARAEAGLEDRLAGFRETMLAARQRAGAWTLEADGFEAASGGLAKTYRRARKAMRRAAKDPTTEALHEWRKRVKYHWYHARLLRDIWPDMLKPHETAAHRLSDLLGDHHDLAVFREALAADPDSHGEPTDLEAFVGLIERRQAAFEAEAFRLGRALLAEKPSALTRRWGAYWKAWREREATARATVAA